MSDRPFLDTNVVLYAFVRGDPRGPIAEALLASGATVSVQVLNEFCAIARRKLGMSWSEVGEALEVVRTLSGSVVPITLDTHGAALAIAGRYGYRIYDALIVAAALAARCDLVLSEDLQDGQRIDGLVIRNPFKGA
ncbi:MAG: PIN domain-containing protein [Alphaproteobacteria bacterium]|nr:PIN domain-containing protein [Alphaproteobacteria bacterium]